MDCCLSKHKSWFNWLLLIMIMIHILMFGITQGGCIEEERKALLEIKASLVDSFVYDADPLVPTWVDDDGECCDWERVECNTTTGHVVNLLLGNIMGRAYDYDERIWRLNVSLFLHFKELRSLNMSSDHLDNGIVSTGLEKLSRLKSLAILDLSGNDNLEGNFPAHEFAALQNLEVLNLSSCQYHGSFEMHGFEERLMLKKLKVLNLAYNSFNESVITSLNALPSLQVLDLSGNPFSSETFPAQDLAHLTDLEKLDLGSTGIQSIQGCKNLLRLKRLESLSLGGNSFNRSVISCLSSLPSLKILYLHYSDSLGTSFPMQELSRLTDLEELDLSNCGLDSLAYNGTMSTLVHLNLNWNNLNKDDVIRAMAAFPSLRFLSLQSNNISGTLPMEALASLRHLEVLDMSGNYLVGSIPSAISTLSSLEVVSFANNQLNGSLPDDGLCRLKNLRELDLSENQFCGNLSECLSSLTSLKLFDISSNQFKGTLPPPLFSNLTYLEYVDFSYNRFEGSLSFSSFSNYTKLEVVEFISNNDKFEVLD